MSDNAHQFQMPQEPCCVTADPRALRYRTTYCETYESSGNCRYGPRCMFAHKEHHLRTEEQNLRDGLTSMEAIKAYQKRGYQISEMKKAQEARRVRVEQRAEKLFKRMMRMGSGDLYCHNPYASVHAEEELCEAVVV